MVGNPTYPTPLVAILFARAGFPPTCKNGGTLEHAQQIAAQQSPRTTKLYDRTKDEIALDEVDASNSK
jgi:integrase/recombinase XerD